MCKLEKLNTNSHVLHTGRYLVLFSYETPVAAFNTVTGKTYITDVKYSVTTNKHINAWLKGVEPKIESQDFFNNLFNEV